MREEIFLETAKPIGAFQSVETSASWQNWILRGKTAIRIRAASATATGEPVQRGGHVSFSSSLSLSFPPALFVLPEYRIARLGLTVLRDSVADAERSLA